MFLRLHVIANSDSDADQELKLKVRDKILQSSGGVFAKDCNIAEAKETVKANIAEIEKNRARNSCGKTVMITPVKVTFGKKRFFPQKHTEK
ncbi:MAG: stage II sporulation protein R [Clostridiales bacterium]|nr:MAG: stage II sporulation protein R [Clostridiales bacterium]